MSKPKTQWPKRIMVADDEGAGGRFWVAVPKRFADTCELPTNRAIYVLAPKRKTPRARRKAGK